MPHPPWRKSLGKLSDASLVHRDRPPLCSDVSSVHIFAGDEVPLPSQLALALAGVDFHETLIVAKRIQHLSETEIQQYLTCKLCGKLNDTSHMRSKGHMQKVVEQAHLDVALGPPSPFRLRSLTPLQLKGLLRGPNAADLCQKRFLEHWGSDVQSLCQFALNRFKTLGTISLRNKKLLWNDQYKASLFVVSYSGQGKYNNRSVGIPWDMIPKKENEPSDWQIALPPEASGASSWWPTVHVWLPGDHDTENEYHWLPTVSGSVLVVVCVYQWLWPDPRGWDVQLANWSRL